MNIKFFDALEAGNIDFTPYIVVDNKDIFPKKIDTTVNDELIHLHCQYDNNIFEDIYFTKVKGQDAVIGKRVFNNGEQQINLVELGCNFTHLKFEGAAKDDYFYHNENPRIYERMTFPLDYNRTSDDASDSEYDVTAGNRWADPGVVTERIGRSPYQPFPAIHMGNYQSKKGIVHGTLAQDVFYHNYLVGHDDNGAYLKVYSSFKTIDYLEVAPNRILTDLWYIGVTRKADDIEEIFANYTSVLRKYLPANYGASYINRDNLVWGSWNDGIFFDVTEDIVLKEAKFLKENFPTVKWIQLDDGYAAERYTAHGLGVPYEGKEGIDYNKFPEGLRSYTDKIRNLGLRPAIWIGGFCNKQNKIYKEHPEWFCDYDFRVKSQSPLDVSKKEVREYMEHALDVLVSQYGFEGVKHDFWSYAFEESHHLLSNRDKSGYEHRDWWLKEMRKRIDADGYFQTGCDIVMGNPFLGKYFTNYRYGIDIGDGNWDYINTTFQWGAACFATHTGDLFVPNSDSIALFPNLTHIDAMFVLNYCMITRSMVEIAGKLSLTPNHERMSYLKKAACCVNNGEDVYFVNYDYRRPGRHVPNIFYLKSPQYSTIKENNAMAVRTVGLFNTFDEDKLDIKFTIADLKLDSNKKYRAFDLWTKEEYTIDENGALSFNLIPHESVALLIIEDKLALIDSNVEVKDIAKDDNSIEINFAYDYKNCELFFTKPVKGVKFNGNDIDAKVMGSIVNLNVQCDGIYQFIF